MKDSDEISVQVGGRGKFRTLEIDCDPATMTELAALIYSRLQNVKAKPVPPHDVSHITLVRRGPEESAQQTIRDNLTIFGCLGGLVLGLIAFSFMVIGFVATVEWLRGS